MGDVVQNGHIENPGFVRFQGKGIEGSLHGAPGKGLGEVNSGIDEDESWRLNKGRSHHPRKGGQRARGSQVGGCGASGQKLCVDRVPRSKAQGKGDSKELGPADEEASGPGREPLTKQESSDKSCRGSQWGDGNKAPIML